MSGNHDGWERALRHALLVGVAGFATDRLLGKRRSHEELSSLVRGFKVTTFYVALPGFLLGFCLILAGLSGDAAAFLVGAPLAFLSFFALAFLIPNYYLLRGDLRRRERAMGTARKIAEGRPLDSTDRRTSGAFSRHVGGGVYLHRDGTYRDKHWNEISDDDPRLRDLSARPKGGGASTWFQPVHIGAGHYLHPDGRYRDQAGNEVPADDPRFKMLSKVGIERMSDADLKAHFGWINRTHAGGGLFVHGDGRFSDPDWNELSVDDPRVRAQLDKEKRDREGKEMTEDQANRRPHRYCTNCGAELGSGAASCAYCG